MTMFWSATLTGFCDSDLFGDALPLDAVELPESLHSELLTGQAEGRAIIVGPDGLPTLYTASHDEVTQRDLTATLGAIAATRYMHETGGIVVNNMPIDTGRDSQSLITGARLAGLDDPTYLCNWKTSDGFVTLSADLIKAIANAIRAHVQACFDREGVLQAAVKDGTYTDSMLNEGWPVSE